MKHTKTPWHVNAITAGRIVGNATVKAEKYQINSANNTIATVYRSSDAEFLVRACNAHYDLVEALEMLLQDCKEKGRSASYRQAESALKLAYGE